MSEGIDYSYDRPKPADIVKAGKKFVVRYITPSGRGLKGIDQAEYDALKAAKLEIAVVWEGNAKDPLLGRAQGVADAAAAQASLRAVVGLNDRLPVYFAIDWDASGTEMRKVADYFAGVVSVLGLERVGVYGGRLQVKRIHDLKLATYIWQTLAWSGGDVLPEAHLYQYQIDLKQLGGQIDLVRSLKADYGQKGIAAPAPVVTASIAPTTTPRTIGLRGSVVFASGAKIKRATLVVEDSNGKKTTAQVHL